MSAKSIKPFKRIVPMIYAYTTPEITRHNGWSKIGYTEAQTVEERVREQCHTADVAYDIEWRDNAMYKDGSGEYFTDKAFHRYLVNHKHVEQEDDKNNEWFHIEPELARKYFEEFASRGQNLDLSDEHADYTLRAEQESAVLDAFDYFERGGEEFLWNCKPRFGKTLSAYDLVRRIRAKANHPLMVLIVTNRPSVANSWADDFRQFVGWRHELCFVSDVAALNNRPDVYTREEYLRRCSTLPEFGGVGMVAFESLQNLKGSIYFGGKYDKLEWLTELEFDLLIVDESQEGVDTLRTERAFDRINRKHTLFLSGTPFKALADGRFSDEQIYNWSYVDEQRAKRDWGGDEFNVYERLPELQMFTYQMSSIVEEEVRSGAAIGDGKSVSYAFDLNEFFSTNANGVFIHEADVSKFLDALVLQERFPFSSEDLRSELSHTLWILDRVASAKALKRKLGEHPVFSQYEVVLAAGDGMLEEDEDRRSGQSLNRVRKAIATHEKTITISVGQLTVGVTVPEWSGVLMLSNMKSPSSYMQAVFRVQNPYETTVCEDGRPVRVRKEHCYVFDFDPARTLVIFDEFANNLSNHMVGGAGSTERRCENIRELLNFFPVLTEDENGKMVEIDEHQVLSIPCRIKSREVVRHGFISNYLFQNIGTVFMAPSAVTEIMGKMETAKEDSFSKARLKVLESAGDVRVDERGEVSVPDEIVIGRSAELFGEKVYERLEESVSPALDEFESKHNELKWRTDIENLKQELKKALRSNVVDEALSHYNLKKNKHNQVIRETDARIDATFEKFEGEYEQQVRVVEAEHNRRLDTADTSRAMEIANASYRSGLDEAMSQFTNSVADFVRESVEQAPEMITKKLETLKAEEERDEIKDSVRAHLRGFARTIPSLIMAYGDESLTLANFDTYMEDDVFEEVTGITEEDFRFLRDGGDRPNPTTGVLEHFDGGIFNETVFNDSIKEFLRKKDELADYFDESQDEDIFDYIPPQRTNLIFTPRWIVKMMVDQLEMENPGCFDDPSATFADLYMKSGLFITEVVKRLFKSEGLCESYPNPDERIRHILRTQVYGMAPKRIIYLIATNYILGFDERLRDESRHFVCADAAQAAKGKMLPTLIDELFG